MSLLSRLSRNFIEARERKVRGQVYATLLNFDDATLARAGYSREALRKQATTPVQF